MDHNSRRVKILMMQVLLLIPSLAQAACFRDCESSGTPEASFIRGPQNNSMGNASQNNDSFNRFGSADTGNVNKSIVGDVLIRNGHEQMTISGINSQQTMIDASITSVVNLGDTTNK